MGYPEILGILFIFYVLFNKLLVKKNLFLDPGKSLAHKSFLNQSDKVPFSGGILILLSCLIKGREFLSKFFFSSIII